MSDFLKEKLPRSLLPYWLFCFDDQNQRQPAEIIDAEGDAVVIALVWLQLNNHWEVWQGDRLVFGEPGVQANGLASARPAYASLGRRLIKAACRLPTRLRTFAPGVMIRIGLQRPANLAPIWDEGSAPFLGACFGAPSGYALAV